MCDKIIMYYLLGTTHNTFLLKFQTPSCIQKFFRGFL